MLASKFVDLRVGESCQVEIISDMLHVKPFIQTGKLRSVRHVFIKQQSVFVKPSWHAKLLTQYGSLRQATSREG